MRGSRRPRSGGSRPISVAAGHAHAIPHFGQRLRQLAHHPAFFVFGMVYAVHRPQTPAKAPGRGRGMTAVRQDLGRDCHGVFANKSPNVANLAGLLVAISAHELPVAEVIAPLVVFGPIAASGADHSPLVSHSERTSSEWKRPLEAF